MGTVKNLNIKDIYTALENELEDLYSEGVISAAIYNKKTPRLLLLSAINQADIHICLQLKLSAHIAIFVPKDQATVFFDRQKEYISNLLDQYEDILAVDPTQYNYFLSDKSYLDIISVKSEYALATQEIPLDGASSGTRIYNSAAEDVQSPSGTYTYQTTGGSVKTSARTKYRFYVDPNQRKMVLSKPFSTDMWVRLEAMIAPVRLDIFGSDGELDKYVIRCPYYARQWLIDRSMIHLLSSRAANAGGYFDTEQISKAETFQNQPATGNIIIPGDELDGNYEGNFEDF